MGAQERDGVSREARGQAQVGRAALNRSKDSRGRV